MIINSTSLPSQDVPVRVRQGIVAVQVRQSVVASTVVQIAKSKPGRTYDPKITA